MSLANRECVPGKEVNATSSAVAEHGAPGAATDESPFGPSRLGLTIGLLLTVSFVAFETLAVATVLPVVVADLGGLHLYGWAFSAFLLTQMVGIVVSGLLADERGPALPFVLGIGFFSVGLLVGGLAPTMPALIAGRALQGLGGGAIGAIAYVAIGRGYPASVKPRMLALLSTAWVLPGLIGPGLAGVMSETLGWRAIFLALAPLPGAAALLAYPVLRRMPSGMRLAETRARVVNAVMLAAGAGLLLAGLGRLDAQTAVPLIVVGTLVALFGMRRLFPPGTLRAAPGMPATVASMGLLNLAFAGVSAFVPLALVDVRGISVAAAGLALTTSSMTWTAAAWVQARTASWASRRMIARAGLLCLGAAFVVTAAVLDPRTPLLTAFVGWGIAGLGMGLANTTIRLAMLEQAAPGQEGDASASLQLADVLGSALGAGIGGAIVSFAAARGEPLARALLVQDGLMLLVVLLCFVAARGLPRGASPPMADP
jgi:MFS family permease